MSEFSRKAKRRLHFEAVAEAMSCTVQLTVNHSRTPSNSYAVPDLAFSEMNFLRKRRFVADDVADTDEPYKRQKKDRKRATEEEISSYFAPKRPPLLERSQNDAQPPRAAARTGTQHDDGPQRQSSPVPSIRTTIEKPILPELVDTNRSSRSTSNTYFTWSDSLCHSSRPAIVRAASTTDLEAYRAVSASTPFTGMKVRASSYDLRPPDLVEHQRRPTRRQITRDSRSNFGDANINHDHAASTATPSRIHLNQQQELDLERSKSAPDELRPTAKKSASNADLESIARTGRPPAQEFQQQNPILSDSTRIPQDVVSAPGLERGDATSTSIANLLTECETAFLRSTRTRSPRLHPAILDHRTRSTNDASTTRQGHFVPQGLSQQFDENPDEAALCHEQEGPFLVGSNQQIHDPRMPELQYYDTYEPSEAEETVGYMHPDTVEYQERVPLQPTVMPTQWPRYESQYDHVVQFRPRDEIPMSDLEDDALEQLELADGEEEEDNGLAGFWRPNMLY
jgi:hypothetical protein